MSTESEAEALGIFDGTWQDGSEDAEHFWHDEGGTDSFKVSPEGKSSVLSSVSDETRTRKAPMLFLCDEEKLVEHEQLILTV